MIHCDPLGGKGPRARSGESLRLDPWRPGLETPGHWKIVEICGEMSTIDRSRCSRLAGSSAPISFLSPLYVLFHDVSCAWNNFILISVSLSEMLLVSTLIIICFSLLQTYVSVWGYYLCCSSVKYFLCRFVSKIFQILPKFRAFLAAMLDFLIFASSVTVNLSRSPGRSFFHDIQYFDVI